MDIAKALIGKTISKFELDEDGDKIKFYFNDGGHVTLESYGDCCSSTWIESIDNEDALLGTVHTVEEINMPDLGNIPGKRHKDVEKVQYYGLKIITDKGHAIIDYRNDSNGYYGGHLEVSEDK